MLNLICGHLGCSLLSVKKWFCSCSATLARLLPGSSATPRRQTGYQPYLALDESGYTLGIASPAAHSAACRALECARVFDVAATARPFAAPPRPLTLFAQSTVCQRHVVDLRWTIIVVRGQRKRGGFTT